MTILQLITVNNTLRKVKGDGKPHGKPNAPSVSPKFIEKLEEAYIDKMKGEPGQSPSLGSLNENQAEMPGDNSEATTSLVIGNQITERSLTSPTGAELSLKSEASEAHPDGWWGVGERFASLFPGGRQAKNGQSEEGEAKPPQPSSTASTPATDIELQSESEASEVNQSSDIAISEAGASLNLPGESAGSGQSEESEEISEGYQMAKLRGVCKSGLRFLGCLSILF